MSEEELNRIMEEEGNEFAFVYNNIICCGMRNSTILNWCGYIVVPALHDYTIEYKKNSDIVYDIDVHGGITFETIIKDDDHLLGKFKDYIISEGDLIVGFDCGHTGDFCPGYVKVGMFHMGLLGEDSIYRDIDYAKDECRSMSNQITEMYPRFRESILRLFRSIND